MNIVRRSATRIVVLFITTLAFVGSIAATSVVPAFAATPQTQGAQQPPQNMFMAYEANHYVVDYGSCTATDQGPGSLSLIYETDYTDSCFGDPMYSCLPEDCGGIISDGTFVRFEPYMSYDGHGHLRSEQQLLDGWYAYAYVDANGNLSNWDEQLNWDGSPLPLTEPGAKDGHMVTLYLQFASATVNWAGHDVCVGGCSFK